MRSDAADWLYPTPVEPGFHAVVTPDNSPCRSLWFFRLNLEKGRSYLLRQDDLELSAVVVAGAVGIEIDQTSERLSRFDAFYLPGGLGAQVTASSAAVVYVGGAPYEAIGTFFTRRYDPSMSFGEVRQMHGKPPYRREVWMAVNQEVPASRLITGLTWGDEGGWTSWPPHQHERDLEEVYCYFDIPAPAFALHLSYTRPGCIEAVHPVSSGDCVVIPNGYHPTVAMPGVKSSYFWVMAAHSLASRSYDLAVPDPLLQA